MLDLDNLKKSFMVCFLDEKGEGDKLMKAVHETHELTARPWVPAQWLLALHRLNDCHANLEVGDLDSLTKELNQKMEDLSEFIQTKTKRSSMMKPPWILNERMVLTSMQTNSMKTTKKKVMMRTVLPP